MKVELYYYLTWMLTILCLLVFHKKDLCEARVNFKVSSYFPMKCTLKWADPPGRGIWWPGGVLHKVILTFSYFQMTCTHQTSWPHWYRHLVAKRSTMSGHLDIVIFSDKVYPQMSWPPSTGIWWSKGVLCKVILTFWRMQLRMHWIHS